MLYVITAAPKHGGFLLSFVLILILGLLILVLTLILALVFGLLRVIVALILIVLLIVLHFMPPIGYIRGLPLDEIISGKVGLYSPIRKKYI